MFNYRDATLEETVQKVLSSKKQAVQAAKRYYTRTGEEDVVKKIDEARKIATIERLKQKLWSEPNVNGVEAESSGLDG